MKNFFAEQPIEQQPTNSFKPQNFAPTPGSNRKIKWLAFLILGLAIIFGFFIFRNYATAKWPNDPVAYDPITLKPKKIGFLQTVRNFVFKSNNILIGQQEDRINILLLGIGGSGHDGPYLSDTNIILSIKPSTNQVAMISIPRDLAVKINEHGVRKINNADAFGEAEQTDGGAEYARKIFEQTFNIKIPYYTRVDFTAFKEIIDAVGGIVVNVERPFVDTQFPGPKDSYQTLSFDAGLQQIDGERALNFARSRHGSNGEDSDFARAKRQQLVIAAFKQKMLSTNTYLNPITLQKIVSSLSKHIITNLNFGQIMYLTSLAKEINTENIKTLVLDDSPNGFLKSARGENDAYLLVPKTGDFGDINSAINNIFGSANTISTPTPTENKPAPATTTPSINIEIQNGTWQAGLAAVKKQELEKDSLVISAVGNSAKRPISATTIYIKNTNVPQTIITNLTNKLHANVTANLPEWLQKAYNDSNDFSDVIIVLGEDSSSSAR
ncbi:MAG TPA: LCP family protein [Candidatus Udaeobacter sp.]|nr:LCP family protein [Candidatus Udaeobacter sp.]